MPPPSRNVDEILGPKGRLAQALPGFEFRPSQRDMARLIAEALQREERAVVEAGTGTGKTFGYLVPVLLSGRKTVISTGTKNLQEQIYHKDIPVLQEASGLKIDALLMKGRNNYLCLNRFHQNFTQGTLLDGGMGDAQDRLRSWIAKTTFGDRAELAWLPEQDPLWDKISCLSDQCPGSECLHFKGCFLNRLRARAAEARIIIVNHHLFFADMKVKRGGFGEVIPRFQAVVFDEAHDVEDIATSHLGESFSTLQLTTLARELEGALAKGRGKKKARALQPFASALSAGAQEIQSLFASQGERGNLDSDTLTRLRRGPARTLQTALQGIPNDPVLQDMEPSLAQALVARTSELEQRLDQVLRERPQGWLNWYERRMKTLTLHASPLNISDPFQELLYQKVKTAVFTSATLSTDGGFDYIRGRMGLADRVREGRFPSHFDYEHQSLLYIPRDLPGPQDNRFPEKAAQRISEILVHTQGRALVLFTSYHNLHVAWDILASREFEFQLLRQGDAPRSVLLEKFRKDIHSVLLATASFWQGVDVPGESLSCVIIDKLPFASPGEPLVAARIDDIRLQGGNPFMDYQVPQAVISLKQGLGRLIRKASDRGVMAILDHRILTSRYGKCFLDSLPHGVPLTKNLNEIDRFLASREGALRS